MKALNYLLPAITCMIVLTGCAGARCHVTANSVPQPVSCTSCVFDASGKIVKTTSREVVRHITLSKYNWTMLWMSVSLNGRNWDISTNLNEMLQKTPGDAVVNVTVTAESCDLFDGFVAGLIPVIPSYSRVTVQGDIVRIPQNNP
jgi:hypothetical protein